jgi:hypothetical protein
LKTKDYARLENMYRNSVFFCNKTRKVNTTGKESPSENAIGGNPRP